MVLAAKPNGAGLLAVSVSEGSGVPKTFPAGKQPELVTASIAAGGFSTATPQLKAWLRVQDQSGAKDIELENLELSATTGNNCSTLSATVSASIPVSQSSVTLDLPGGPKTIAELAGPNGGGQTPDGGAGYPLKLLFSAESTDFDFGSL